jgi:hypothetical protein
MDGSFGFTGLFDLVFSSLRNTGENNAAQAMREMERI